MHDEALATSVQCMSPYLRRKIGVVICCMLLLYGFSEKNGCQLGLDYSFEFVIIVVLGNREGGAN